ncbi:hypothetical protein LLEC1_05753 [Akanthomyces lecanii]|uniref:Uncharacterized protein n=1 Tax=Cordyceps confragosa TaxID=2714763 RepID=A0A179IBH1_CORDF|nr:hypothetical protein LLEC1_05753 [Akanthomyces lecanii]
MFTGIPALAAAERLQETVDPANVPPPTPIAFPRYQPFAQDDAPVELSESLSALLSTTGRQRTKLASTALSAIGLDLKADVDVQQLIPDPSTIPDFAKWDQMTLEQSQDANQGTCRPLCHGKLSPGCHVYLERRTELSYSNDEAFRTIRRVHLPMGKLPPRLGSAYEFFRRLESLTTYWDDPTKVASLPPSPEIFAGDATAEPSKKPSSTASAAAAERRRTQAGHQMPAPLRHMLVATFVKLVAYDFGCNVSPSRAEPRLQLHSPRDSRDKDLPPGAGADAGADAREDAPTPGPPAKKLRKNLAMYDNYRMIRPPAATWDRKVKYMSIGKQAGTDYDDIFLISSLFHHVSFLRMRVPMRLLEVLDGAPEPDPTHRDWGKVQAWRTPWYDLFEAKDRTEAMRLLWSVMAYQMRADTGATQA